MSIVVLGPQASPPARVSRNRDREGNFSLTKGVDATQLVSFDAGRRGRLRSQHDDAHTISELLPLGDTATKTASALQSCGSRLQRSTSGQTANLVSHLVSALK